MRSSHNHSTSPRDTLAVSFIAALCPLREKLRRCYDNELTAFGLSRALAAPLVRIWQNDGLRQNALAEMMDIEGPSVVRLLDQLSASGLVVRRLDPDDQRARTLHLTPAGVELAERIMPVVERLRGRLLADASDADLETCLRVFADFLAACERDGVDVTK
jgi:MarR family transcriptional regulator, transcriptional regulator for hemolysin